MAEEAKQIVEEQMDEEVRQAAESWNGFVSALLDAEKSWKKLQTVVSVMNRAKLENLPTKGQKLISLYWRQNFLVMMPRFIDFFRAYGGLEDTIINLPEKKVEAKVKED